MEIKAITHDSAKGKRPYMEDVHFVTEFSGSSLNGALLGVFDGHGGADSALYAVRNAISLFNDTKGTIQDKLFETIAQLSDGIDQARYEDGTTASLVYIDKGRGEATVAVIGDSPVIIQNPNKSTWFGPDHNVRTNPAELQAAIARGGRLYSGYICNDRGVGLQMGRALGDPALKGILSRDPEVFVVDIEEGGWLLVATDGLFDPAHQSSQDQVDTAKLITDFPSVTAQELVRGAVNAQTGDNVTAILARF